MLLRHDWITTAVYEDVRGLLFYQIEMLAEFCFFLFEDRIFCWNCIAV